MTTELTISTDVRQAAIALLMPSQPSKDAKYRIGKFASWLATTGGAVLAPDLAAYRDHLLTRGNEKTGKGLSKGSVSGQLSTIRARYKPLLNSNELRDHLQGAAAVELQARGQEDTPANVKAMVDEAIARLRNGADPARSEVKTETKQDTTDEEIGLRLTRDQANAMLATPGLQPIDKLRDTCIIGLILATGIREGEVCNLDVEDLRQTKNGELCLHVRHGKGDKTRIVFYGGNEWILRYVDTWLERAHITSGPVFRSFYKPKRDGSRRLRAGRLTGRSVQRIVRAYPVMVGGELVEVHPHDLRRTYARIWYDMGGDLVGLQQNLGHADVKTTLGYIGLLDASKRKPPAMYSPPHWSELENLPQQGEIEIDGDQGAS